MNKRIGWIDVAKGILIILVVLGHSHVSNITSMVINSFHMAAFFMLSGVTFHITDSFPNFFVKKAKSLLLPYLAFSGILLLYQFIKTVTFSGYHFDLFSGIVSIVIPISGRTSTTVYGLWFLPCLFLAELVMYWLKKLNEKSFVEAGAIFVFVCVLCITIDSATGVVSIISILPIAVGFLISGIMVRHGCETIERKKLMFCIVSFILFIGVVVLNYSIAGHTVDLSSMTLGVFPLYILSSFLGSISICSLAMLLKNVKILSCLGRDSLYYYGLHYEVLGAAEKIFRGGDCRPRLLSLYYFL